MFWGRAQSPFVKSDLQMTTPGRVEIHWFAVGHFFKDQMLNAIIARANIWRSCQQGKYVKSRRECKLHTGIIYFCFRKAVVTISQMRFDGKQSMWRTPNYSTHFLKRVNTFNLLAISQQLNYLLHSTLAVLLIFISMLGNLTLAQGWTSGGVLTSKIFA